MIYKGYARSSQAWPSLPSASQVTYNRHDKGRGDWCLKIVDHAPFLIKEIVPSVSQVTQNKTRQRERHIVPKNSRPRP